jgi:hypothetical protein
MHALLPPINQIQILLGYVGKERETIMREEGGKLDQKRGKEQQIDKAEGIGVS